jgi:hypothetical protein
MISAWSVRCARREIYSNNKIRNIAVGIWLVEKTERLGIFITDMTGTDRRKNTAL